jgi:hypothetical protein
MSKSFVIENPFSRRQFAYTVNTVDDLLGERWVYNNPTPNWERIFGCEKKQALKKAKALIIDLFSMIAKDIIGCNQFNAPVNTAEAMNFFVKELNPNSIPGYQYDPRANGRVFFPYLEITKADVVYERTGKRYSLKPDFRILNAVKEKVYQGTVYQPDVIIKTKKK